MILGDTFNVFTLTFLWIVIMIYFEDKRAIILNMAYSFNNCGTDYLFCKKVISIPAWLVLKMNESVC